MPKTEIITMHDLSPDAVFPQCLDNMYVTDNLFRYMVDNKLNFTDPYVNRERRRLLHGELIRSLLYSSEVVVGRHIFQNNPYFFNYFSENTDPEEMLAFSSLVSQEAIIPYLYRENHLLADQDYEKMPEGLSAIEHLLSCLDEIKYLKFSKDEAENHRETSKVSQGFLGYIEGLKRFEDEQFMYMLPQLFINHELQHDEYQSFKDHIRSLAKDVSSDDTLSSRDAIYKKYFTKGENPSLGLFIKPSPDKPFLLEMRKLVDLRYNSNIPDLMQRHTFTPMGLPDRTTLQDWSTTNTQLDKPEIWGEIEKYLNNYKRKFEAKQQEAMWLPFMSELSLADVAEIRNSVPEWSDFIESHHDALNSRWQIVDKLDDLNHKFDGLQRAICDWYNEKYEKQFTEKRYENFVSLAIELGGRCLVLGLAPHIVGDKPDTMADDVLRYLMMEGPFRCSKKFIRRVKGFAVKVMFNVYDHGQKKLDRARSHSVQIWNSNRELGEEELEYILRKSRELGGQPVGPVEKIADQGSA